MIKACAICGGEFEARGNGIKKTCSEKCRKVYRRQFARKWYANNAEHIRKLAKGYRERFPEQKEKARHRAREWAVANPERVKENRHANYIRNKDRRLAYSKQFRKDNPDLARKYGRDYYHRNHDKCTTRRKAYEAQNADAIRKRRNSANLKRAAALKALRLLGVEP